MVEMLLVKISVGNALVSASSGLAVPGVVREGCYCSEYDQGDGGF